MQLEHKEQEILMTNSNQNAPKNQGAESVKEFLWETVKIVIICLIIVIPIKQFIIQPFYVKGASMEPNFYDHEYLLIDEISYRLNQPVRGEIIVFHHPPGEKSFYIKRLIGMPGERIVIKDSKVKIYNQQNPDGFVLDESKYLSNDIRFYDDVDTTLAENEYFVMGDNRMSSLDSRRFGPILREDIVGRTWLRGWPFDRFQIFKTPIY
ncbi:MAG: signal peptidase I [Patescibacteria group bacterium]